MADFTVRIDQNKYLPEGGREVNAIVTVEAGVVSGGPAVTSTTAAVEVIIIDTSGSMDWPRAKIMAAREAATKAVGSIRDGVRFAIISGSQEARMVYPAQATTVVASGETRAAAVAAIGRLRATGGTAIGAWLKLADELFAPHRSSIRHAILLTDGRNQHESATDFDAALAAIAGHFVCDSRGVGTDWSPDELRKVASAMLGDVDIVADPADLGADFEAMMAKAMGKSVADITLRIWTPQGATVKFVKQVLPTVEDLTGKRRAAGPQAGDYPTGSWGAESRDYHVCVEVEPGQIGQEMRAAWVRLVLPAGEGGQDQIVGSGNVLAEWTEDEGDYTTINPRVANYTGQQELAQVIQDGLKAKSEGDIDTATTRLGRAVLLANQTGNANIASLLDKVVDVIDEDTGTVRLKKQVDKADEMSLDTRSTRTIRTTRKE